jgi:predicted metal-dependent phosphotriesterase family hydrolase
VNGWARTVLGDVEPSALGPTYCHEDLMTPPAARFGDFRLDDQDRPVDELER